MCAVGSSCGLLGKAGMGEMPKEPAGTILAGEASDSCICEHVSSFRKWGRAQ